MLITMISLLAIFASLLPPTEACNALLLNTSGQPGSVVAYGRDIQLDTDMASVAVWVPARTLVPFIPICETCSWSNFTVKYGFVGMLAFPDFISGICQSIGYGNNCVSTLTEGMNTAGLGVSVLWDATVTTYLNYSYTQDFKPRRGVAASDLITLLLGSCATVKDVKVISAEITVPQSISPTHISFCQLKSEDHLTNSYLTHSGSSRHCRGHQPCLARTSRLPHHPGWSKALNPNS